MKEITILKMLNRGISSLDRLTHIKLLEVTILSLTINLKIGSYLTL